MIQVLGKEGAQAVYETDVVLVGAGAMGLAMASALLGSNRRVLVVEAGDEKPNPESDALFKAEIEGHPFNGDQRGRGRVFGGSTTLWGGQFLPLPEIVFSQRSWIPVSGWPLTKEELAPYYAEAESFAGLDRRPGDASIWKDHGVDPPPFVPQELECEFSKWSPRPNFAQTGRAALSASSDVDVLLDAAAVDLRLDGDGGRVEEIHVRSLKGETATVRGRVFVLAAGAIESARLLLSSNSQDGRGVGNRHDLVGRYFQDHIAFPAARVLPRDRKHFHRLFDNFLLGATKFAPKVALSAERQIGDSLLNVGGFFRFGGEGDEGAAAMKELLGHLKRGRRPPNPGGLAARAIAGLPSVFRLAYGVRFRHRIFASRRGEIELEAHAEQMPSPESRIRLGTERDALGMPKAVIDWQIDDRSRTAIRAYVDSVREEFRRIGLADIEPYDDRIDDPERFQAAASDVYHHMGTLRMSDDPREGVVDSHCRVHELENLYVAGCSVFPVSGYSNPTHTGLALALRLAHRLRET